MKFNPEVISYEDLLKVFWNCHNPTTLNRQGPDVGSQYRSAIFTHNETQRLTAEKSKTEHASNFDEPIVTEITPASTFYKAEDYHQKYFMKRGGGSCHF